ncbi:MAG: indolepyruvate ferredoxin oxidoreductase family protein [Acidimicrobiales bacterium]
MAYELADRYLRREGRAFMSGVQALARIPVEQLRLDRDAGLNTAAFVSGYQGSPLGGFDQEVARAARLVDDLPIVCRPAVNEELGATAVMGSQLAAEQPDARYDGVLGIWYGKAPGLDRASDALRHAAFAGTSRHGGAIALVGDDPAAKSSTLPSSSDATLVDLHMPILYPGNVQEVLDLGIHAVALSRITGAWSSMKIVAAVADGTSTVDLSASRVVPVICDLVPPGSTDGLDNVHHPDAMLLAPRTLELERDFRVVRAELIRRYAAVNGLNRPTVDPGDAWIGLIAAGYTYHQLRDALRRLGFETDDDLTAAGIRLLQMQMPVSFDGEVVRRFARGLDEIVVVEEKNPTLELLVKDALYALAERPAVYGKRHPDGRTLMVETGLLDADAMVDGLRERLGTRLADRLAPAPPVARERVMIPVTVGAGGGAETDTVVRSPYFCSGCPHNRSTRVPEGSLVGAGIGCHTMVLLMDDDRLGDITGITAMGGEGAQWIGMAPFVERHHSFQNLGDGTFFHSGQLAIQAAVAAGVDLTYKLLYNGTVAMTGGQDAVGAVGVPQIVTALLAHGVADVLVTTDDVGRYAGIDLPVSARGPVQVWDRSRFDEAQRRLAATPGVTVLINDQACAAHTRQLRRRGTLPTPTSRVVINHRICEACGDCGAVSNCLSVQPIDTPLGVKTTIDQDSCNFDLSCMDGDCPSFMTVEVGERSRTSVALPTDPIPDPGGSATAATPWALRLVGIGGTGVVTTSQILGTAAMLDGLEVQGLDQTGLSQKAGPVVSDLRFTAGLPAPTNSIGSRGCDAVIALDLLVAATDRMLAVADPAHTRLVGSTSETPTGSMVGHPEREYPETDALRARLARSIAGEPLLVDAAGWCRRLLGSAAGANIFMIGVAVQAGELPVSPASIATAIELNGVAVEANLAAFAWGRWWVADPHRFPADATPTGPSTPTMVVPDLPAPMEFRIDAIATGASADSERDLDDLLRVLAADLVAYQDARYAGRFLARIERVRDAERRVDAGTTTLTTAAARSLHQLMAYKDEYEVARLLLSPEAEAAATAVGGPGATVTWRLHPPTLAALGMGRKIAIPAAVGRPVMATLARGKRLRGTAADPFGRTEVRRTERRILAELEHALDTVAAGLTAERYEEAVRIAELARAVRGYERLKLERAETFTRELRQALASYAS